MLGAVRWLNGDVADSVLLGAADRRGIDVTSARRRLLAALVNEPDAVRTDVAGFVRVPARVARALTAELEAARLVDFVTAFGGADGAGRVMVTRVDPLARRHLRQQG